MEPNTSDRKAQAAERPRASQEFPGRSGEEYRLLEARTIELERRIEQLQQDIKVRERTDEALKELVAGTATVTGEEFFPALVRHLALSLGVRYALVSECVNRRAERVRSLAWWVGDTWDENFEYDTKDTTCEAVLNQGKLCYYPDHVQELFPKETALVEIGAQCYLGCPLFDSDGKTLGHLFVIDVKPLADPEHAKSIISIFAARAAMELQRKQAEEALQNLVSGTAAVTSDEFFPALVRHLAHALDVRFATVAECIDEEMKRARVLARWADDHLEQSFVYEIAHTPCEVVLNDRKMCFYPENVQASFPENTFLPKIGAVCYLGVPLFEPSGKTIGHMYVVDDKPLVNEKRARSIIGIFAARAAMELHRKQSEEVIMEQATLLDKAHDAIILTDMGNVIRYWNKGAEELYGWSAEEAVGKEVLNLLFREGPAIVAEAFQSINEKGEWRGNLKQRTRSGKEVTVESRWTLVRDRDGKPKSVLAINSDITEQTTLQAQFYRAQRLESIGTLASGVAHDLNNVLTPITLAAETLRGSKDPKLRKPLIKMIEQNAKRGADIVHQVLTFARGVEVERSPLKIGHLVKEVEKIVRETFPKAIKAKSSIPSDVWTVSGDPTQLHQVLLNLCLNARDAMPAGGTISFHAENIRLDDQFARMHIEAKPGPHVLIKMSDTGAGMKPEVMDKIFEPFFTTKEPGKGTGLGLSTALSIVRSHGGFLGVYSEPGRGTTFSIYLPALGGDRSWIQEQRRVSMKGKGELVLVVDDESAILSITKATLEANGYKVVTARDGTEALAAYASHRKKVKVVLMDMMMPYMDGPLAIRALQKMNPDVRIIATSGLMTAGKAAEAAEIGVTRILPKPYTTEKLLAAIKEELGRKSQTV